MNPTSLSAHSLTNQQLSAKQIMAMHGKTFAFAAKLLNPASRNDSAELYAFARTVDDLVDMQATNQQVKMQVMHLKNVINMDETAIQAILQKYAISAEIMQAFLQAQIDDDDGRCMQTQQALIDYAYGVAGSIGAMMRPILGASKKGEIYAISLGIAMQLTNIARDVAEDAARMRIYLPATFFGKPIQAQNIVHPSQQEAQIIFTAITQLLCLAGEYYSFARLGYRYIPLRNRLSIAAAAAMYGAIGQKIIRGGSVKYWQGRVSISAIHKAGIAIIAISKTLAQCVIATEKPQKNMAVMVTSIQHAIAHYGQH